MAVLLAVLLAACDGPRVSGATARSDVMLVRVGGDFQEVPALAALRDPLEVRVLERGTLRPRPGQRVRFALDAASRGRAYLSDSVAYTDHDGVARTEAVAAFGREGEGGEVRVTARDDSGVEAWFTIRVAPAPIILRAVPFAAGPGDTVVLHGRGLLRAAPPGEIRFGGRTARVLHVSDTLVRAIVPPCVQPGPQVVALTNRGVRAIPAVFRHVPGRSALALAPLGGAILPATQLGECVVLTAAGARYLVVAQMHADGTSPDEIVVEFGVSDAGAEPVATPVAAGPDGQFSHRRGGSPPPGGEAGARAFEQILRARERAIARGGSPAVAGAPRDGAHGDAATAGAQPVAGVLPGVGALRTFRIISRPDATAFESAGTRLAFQGRHVLVWVDTAATAELDDAVLLSHARLFDEELYTLVTHGFGAVSDVDRNGRVDVVLSPIVNRLTPRDRCSASGFVAGFFSAHDLYPAAPNANGGEVLYGFVPDSLARFGCPHPVSEFSRVIRTTFVHELQHLVNYNQKVFLRGGVEEDIWLNEGLSHIAEEMASRLYEARYPAPAGRGLPEQLFPDSSQNFILFNLINAYLYLRQPYAASLTHFIEGGTLEERGAAWLFLRWLADQHGEGVLRRLVQTRLTGRDNVANRAGEPFERLVGDFALALVADSVPGMPRTAVPSRWRFASRNWRQIFQRLNVVAGLPSYPIEPIPVPPGGVVAVELRIGGLAIFQVDVPQGAAGTTLRFAPRGGASWREVGARPQVSILRIQ